MTPAIAMMARRIRTMMAVAGRTKTDRMPPNIALRRQVGHVCAELGPKLVEAPKKGASTT